MTNATYERGGVKEKRIEKEVDKAKASAKKSKQKQSKQGRHMMSTETKVHCDRCNTVIEGDPHYIRVVTFDAKETEPGTVKPVEDDDFGDLCGRCDNTVRKGVKALMQPYKRRGKKVPVAEVPPPAPKKKEKKGGRSEKS